MTDKHALLQMYCQTADSVTYQLQLLAALKSREHLST